MNRYCSFCFKSQREANILIGGTGVYICDACVKNSQNVIDTLAERRKTANLPTFEEQKEEALLGHLPNADKVLKQASEALYVTVDLLRARKVSWQKIGDALSISRQAAWERFSK